MQEVFNHCFFEFFCLLSTLSVLDTYCEPVGTPAGVTQVPDSFILFSLCFSGWIILIGLSLFINSSATSNLWLSSSSVMFVTVIEHFFHLFLCKFIIWAFSKILSIYCGFCPLRMGHIFLFLCMIFFFVVIFVVVVVKNSVR